MNGVLSPQADPTVVRPFPRDMVCNYSTIKSLTMLSQSTQKPGGVWGPLLGLAGMIRRETKEIETKMSKSSGSNSLTKSGQST